MDQNPDGRNVADVNEDLLDEESDCDNADGAMGHLPHINPADLMITGMKVEVMHFSYFWTNLIQVRWGYIYFLLKGDPVASGEMAGSDDAGQGELSEKKTSKSGVKVFICSE